MFGLTRQQKWIVAITAALLVLGYITKMKQPAAETRESVAEQIE